MKFLLLLLCFSYSLVIQGQNNLSDPINFDESEAADTIQSINEPEEEALDIQVFIPNIFSPNGDGVNDLFQIRAATENNLLITRFYIFDRWGFKVYERFNLPIHSSDGWWDGTLKRFTLTSGVFAYYIEMQYPNGERKTFKGDVTLMR